MLAIGFVTDPEHWRELAQDMRLTASSLKDERAKARMLKIVRDIARDFRRRRLNDGRGNAILVAGSIYECVQVFRIIQPRESRL